MSFFIGIDGGGTKTKAVLSNKNLKVIYDIESSPSNFLTIGTDIVSETIINLVDNCVKSKNINYQDISSVVLGTTGAGRENDANNLERAVINLSKKKEINFPLFKVISDARIALEGAFSGGAGSILISGTGSIMFGKDRFGNIHRVGGCGRLIGDEGSGLTIGRKGLNILSKYFDGRAEPTLLTQKVSRVFGINNQTDLINKVYSENVKIQHVTPLVIEAAIEGDDQCYNILNEETDELILHIISMYKKLDEEKMKLVFIGGTIANDNLYSDLLKEKINKNLPNIIIQAADNPPEIGAVLIAKQISEKL